MDRDVLKVEYADPFFEHDEVDVGDIEHLCKFRQPVRRRCVILCERDKARAGSFYRPKDDKVIAQPGEELKLLSRFFLQDVLQGQGMKLQQLRGCVSGRDRL